MQVISGKYRSKTIKWPKSARPTSMRAKEALFNTMFSLVIVPTDTIWDAFAGSGAIGIECLSRGWVKTAYFSDIDPEAVAVIKSNLNSMEMQENSIVLQKSAVDLVKKYYNSDIIFMDAPYKRLDLIENMLKQLKELSSKAMIIIELESSTLLPNIIFESFDIIKDKSYGRARFLFLKLR